jgi:hypothetical protein
MANDIEKTILMYLKYHLDVKTKMRQEDGKILVTVTLLLEGQEICGSTDELHIKPLLDEV